MRKLINMLQAKRELLEEDVENDFHRQLDRIVILGQMAMLLTLIDSDIAAERKRTLVQIEEEIDS